MKLIETIKKSLTLLFFISMMTTYGQTVTATLEATIRDISEVKIGFNRRSNPGSWWTDGSFINLVAEMNPDVVRYPAGTQANYWNWNTGQFIENTDKVWGNKEVVTIPTFINALPNRTKTVYVVNIARPTPATGADVNASEAILKSDATLNLKITDMLNAINAFSQAGKLPYAIELGNEFYFGNIESGIFQIQEVDNNGTTEYYSGWDQANNAPFQSSSKQDATDITALFYLEQAKVIVNAIKMQYPNMKFALCTTKSGNGNSARERWNSTIFDNLQNNPEFTNLSNDIDAVTQHHYLNDSYGVQTVITNNTEAKVAIAEGIQYPVDKQADYNLVPHNYKIWYTEYGEVKEIAEETWASGLRYAALVYSWLNRGDKVEQLHYHHISDDNVVQVGSPMQLAPIGIAQKLIAQALVDMTEMQNINFTTNPISVNGVESLFGYKFKNAEKETLLIINISDTDFTDVQIDNLFTYTGTQNLTQYHSTQPYVFGVAEGDANIISTDATIFNTFNARRFSINVVEVENILSINDIDEHSVAMYPNPVTDILTIDSNAMLQHICVYSINGAKVFTTEKVNNNTIDLSALTSGMYILKIETNKGSVFKKLIKI
ncbi:T9SS type A sorting domain-containing protein [Winogradskyella sp.]|nr:T9SS type A sorting domain-containing protein [Winogradskyella sp.]MDB9782530.1 T9SS type A sorting domain-containing protein [Winogradskyella sp.]